MVTGLGEVLKCHQCSLNAGKCLPSHYRLWNWSRMSHVPILVSPWECFGSRVTACEPRQGLGIMVYSIENFKLCSARLGASLIPMWMCHRHSDNSFLSLCGCVADTVTGWTVTAAAVHLTPIIHSLVPSPWPSSLVQARLKSRGSSYNRTLAGGGDCLSGSWSWGGPQGEALGGRGCPTFDCNIGTVYKCFLLPIS